jgi:hypothetical protein
MDTERFTTQDLGRCHLEAVSPTQMPLVPPQD